MSKIGWEIPKNEKTHKRIRSSNFWRDEGAKVVAGERGVHRWQSLGTVGFKLRVFKLGPCLFRTQ